MAQFTADEIHSALVAEGTKQSLPTCYKNDLLVHDLAQLANTGTQEFIWVLRESGTHIITLDERIDGQPPHRFLKMLGTFADENRKWYHFHNGKLAEVTYDKALSISLSYQFTLHR
jgi:hypothetical protein